MNAIVFSGPEQVSVYQAICIKHALAMYARTGMKVNRAYTPKNMMAMVAKITGAKLAARDYTGGVAALQKWVDDVKLARANEAAQADQSA